MSASSPVPSTTMRGLRQRLALLAAIVACFAAAALVAASAQAKPTAATDTQATGLQQDLDALVAAGAPGAILFVRNGTHTVQLAAGMSDIAHKTPIVAGDHFKIGSLTKAYTATVVLQLVGEGKLSLDDSVQQRLPGVVPNGSKITIRQLLNHTSGLFDFENEPRYLKPYLSGNFGYHWAPRQLVTMAVSHKPLFAPGTRWSYSNTNYVVAQLIVEKVTGHTIGAELKRRIFQPLGLRNTIYPIKPGLRALTRTATGISESLPWSTSRGLVPHLRRHRERSSRPSATSPTSTGPCFGDCSSPRSCER